MQNNSVDFWTAFVHEYFAPGAYMRVIINNNAQTGNQHASEQKPRILGTKITSSYANAGDVHVCNAHAEAPLEILPRLFHIKYDSGLKEELLYLSDPQEVESHTGLPSMLHLDSLSYVLVPHA